MQVFGPVFVLAVALLLIGLWGRRNVTELAFVPGMEGYRVARRARVMRRGAVTCLVVGLLFLAVAVLSMVYPP